MARFVFKLEPLLTARKRVEQDRQLEVAVFERNRLALETRLRRHQQAIFQSKSDRRENLLGDLNTQQLRVFANASIQQTRAAQRVVLELAGVHRRLESARNLLLEAVKQRRAIELLRERRYEQHLADLNKADAAAMDELAVMRAARKESASCEPCGVS